MCFFFHQASEFARAALFISARLAFSIYLLADLTWAQQEPGSEQRVKDHRVQRQETGKYIPLKGELLNNMEKSKPVGKGEELGPVIQFTPGQISRTEFRA